MRRAVSVASVVVLADDTTLSDWEVRPNRTRHVMLVSAVTDGTERETGLAFGSRSVIIVSA